MSVTRSSRNVNRKQVEPDGEDSDPEESQIIEERLKNLLKSTTGKDIIKARNIFNDFQGDVPKLRNSIITRALQKVVCSTPMPTEKYGDFFPSESSFNISPIDPLTEELDNNQDKIKSEKQNVVFDKEPKVVLKRTPVATIVILDSSSETENHVPNKVKHKSLENKKDTTEKKIPYNTRRQNKNTTKEKLGEENSNSTAIKGRSKSNDLANNTKINPLKSPPKRPPRKKRERARKTANCEIKPNTRDIPVEVPIPDKIEHIPNLNETFISNSRVIVGNTVLQPEDVSVHQEEATQANSLIKSIEKVKSAEKKSDISLELKIPTPEQTLRHSKRITNLSNPESVTKRTNKKISLVEAGTSPCSFAHVFENVFTPTKTSVSTLTQQIGNSSNPESVAKETNKKNSSKGFAACSFAQVSTQQIVNSSNPESVAQVVNKKNSSKTVATSPCSFAQVFETKLPPTRVSVATSPMDVGTLGSRVNTNASVTINQTDICSLEKDSPRDKSFVVPTEIQLMSGNTSFRSTNPLNKTTHPKRVDVIDAGTSPLGNSPHLLGYGKDATLDKAKVDKLNKLLTKMSQKFIEPGDAPTKNNNQCLGKEEDLKSTPIESSSRKTRNRMTREVQTSLRRSCRTSPRKSVAKRIFTRTVIEQQTQTTSSVDNRFKTYKRNKSKGRLPMGYASDSSRNTSTTDQSEVLKEIERENMLFQSLAEEVLPPSFSSSEDEILYSVNEKSRPWRLDNDIIQLPRRSSYNLNFLRSAREIELEKESSMFGKNNLSDSDSEVENEKKKKPNEQRQFGYTRKNRLQVYTKPGQEKDATSVKARLQEPLTDEEVSSLSSEDVRIPRLDFDLYDFPEDEPVGQSDEPQNIPANEVVAKNHVEDGDLETTLTTENVDVHNKTYANDCLEDRVANLLHRSATPPLQHMETPVVNNRNSNKASVCQKENDTVDDEGNCKALQARHEDDEILAVPLEDSDVPDVNGEEIFTNQRVTRASKGQQVEEVDNTEVNDNQQNEGNRTVEIQAVEEKKSTSRKTRASAIKEKELNSAPTPTPQAKEPVFKVPKGRGRKSKKQIALESDDCVSSTTEDSTEHTGIRRSGRERKPTQRRVLGVVATHSEKILQYYNGTKELPSNIKTDVTINRSSKPRTKKQNNTKKRLEMKENEKSEVKSAKHSRRTNKLDTKEQGQPKVIQNDDIAPSADDERSQNEPNVTLQTAGDNLLNVTSKSFGRKKRNNSIISSTTNVTINNETQVNIPKKSRKTNDSKYSETKKSPNKNRNAKRKSRPSDCHVSDIEKFAADGSVNNEVNVSSPSNNANPDPISAEHPYEGDRNGDTDDFVRHSSEPGETIYNNTEEHNKLSDKDSGRSTMLKSTTFDDSHSKFSKPLTGRIGKKYKKSGNNIGNKISKVLSRSVNRSSEFELFNAVSVSHQDDKSVRRSSLMQSKFTEGDHINLLCNNDIVSMKYMDPTVNYKVVRDNLMVTDSLKIGDGTMGYLKLLPGCQKPLHIARKYNLGYFVIEGQGLIQVHNKTSRVGKLSRFGIPLGVEYSINNLSKEDPLVLAFIKMPPNSDS